MDIYWRDAVICPTEDDYKLMVIRSESSSVADVGREKETLCVWQVGSCVAVCMWMFVGVSE